MSPKKASFFKEFASNSLESIIVVDSNKHIVYSNRTANTTFGFNSNELNDQSLKVLLTEASYEAYFKNMYSHNNNSVTQTRGQRLMMYGMKKNGDTIPVEVSMSGFNFENSRYCVVIISDITQRINREKKIQEFIVKQEEINKRFIKAQLEILKKQISPHFLFNCLSILYSIIDDDSEKAKKFVKKIIDIFAYVLETRNRKLVNASEELKILKTYLSVQGIRFQNQFQVYYKNLDSLIDYEIVPFSLQLVVENIFKHNKLTHNTKFLIEIYKEDDFIVVKNPIKKKFRKYKSFGVGLENLRLQHQLVSNTLPVIEKDKSLFFIIKIPLLKRENYD